MSLCETRFLERHTAVVTFRQLFGFVAEALQEIKSWSSPAAVRSTSSLYASMHQFEFVVGLVILPPVASVRAAACRRERPNTGIKRCHRSVVGSGEPAIRSRGLILKTS